jgi:hypothetical protein
MTKHDDQDGNGMTIFTLTSHVNGSFETVTATRRGAQIVVDTRGAPALARNVRQATRLAAEALGPALERAGRSGSIWGLYVDAGASATFGRFPEDPLSPSPTGPPARPSEPIVQIFNEWKRHDGTPLGALDAALKIIEIYADRRPERTAA